MGENNGGCDEVTEELPGPKKSKTSIDLLEDWLKKNCTRPMPVDRIKATWQYLTGHEPRKTSQYLSAIETSGKIELSSNDGETFCTWVGKPSDTPFMDYARQMEAEEAKPKLTLAQIIDQKMREAAEIKAKMQAGPCKNRLECPPGTEDSCEHCSGYIQQQHPEWNRDLDFEED